MPAWLSSRPANTSDEFTCWADEGLYFRTAPPDSLQAQALAALMAADGAQRISILARNDPYCSGLATTRAEPAGCRNRAEPDPEDHLRSDATSYNTAIDASGSQPDAIADRL